MDRLTQPTSPPSSPLSSVPSSPLSELSDSPSPPASPTLGFPTAMDAFKRYPSPSSSSIQSSGCATPLKRARTEELLGRMGGPPPAKRRKVIVPKVRTTEHIDLEDCDEDEEAHLDRLIAALRRKKKIVVIAGAGISVSAGIPDFRSSTGLFTTLRGDHKLKGSGKQLFDASVYKHDSSTASFHDMLRQMSEQISQAKPTAFHHLLASLAQEGRLLRLYTQNIDCLDTNMDPLATTVPLNHKGPWPKTIQLHGGLDKMVCSKCGHVDTFDPSLFDGPETPSCRPCLEMEEVRTSHAGKRSHGVGKLRPRIVLYNEHHPDQEAIGQVSGADLKKVPDAVIVVGTTLKVPGVRRIVKEMCQVTRSRRDGITAWINLDPEPQGADLKDCWDLVIKGKCDDVAELVNLPHWDEQDIGDRVSYMVTDDETKEKHRQERLSRDRIEVPIPAKRVDQQLPQSSPSKRTTVEVQIPRKQKADSEGTESSLSTFASSGMDTIRPKLVTQAQRGDGGIPTPVASPKPRSALPDKPTPKNGSNAKTKQSKLAFGNPTSAAKENQKKTPNPVPAVPAKKPAPKPRKSTSTKAKSAVPPKPAKNALNTAFKATKVVSALPSVKNEKKLQDDERALRRSSRSMSVASVQLPVGNVLPDLRPALKTPEMKALPFVVETISPDSKPRSMGHLID